MIYAILLPHCQYFRLSPENTVNTTYKLSVSYMNKNILLSLHKCYFISNVNNTIRCKLEIITV